MDRDIAMVFQNYALYPHMSVAYNMAFGLKMRKFEKSRDREADQERGRDPRHRGAAAPQAAPALGRPAPARRARPRHRARSGGLPVRRAALQPRRQAARADAGRAQEAARAAGRHLGLRHARPGRGDDPGRPRRGDEGRRGPAGRRAARALQHAGQPLRRRLHRLAGDELRRRDPGGERWPPDRRGPRPAASPCPTPSPRARAPRSAARRRSASGPRISIVAGAADSPDHCFDASVEVVEQLGSEILLDMRVGAGYDGGQRRARP